jgi:hypothetical protein
MVWRRWIVGVALVLAGCAGTPVASDGSCKRLAYLDLAPGSLGYSLSLSQIVSGEYNGESHSMRFEVEITPKQVVMVGLTHVGVRLFTLKQDAGGLKVDSLLGKRLPFEPCYILSDMQLTYWPEEVLRQALLLKGLRLKGDGHRRQLFGADGTLLVEIIYPVGSSKAGETVVQHHNLPYQLRIRTLQRRMGP